MATESLASYAEVLKILFEEDVVESLNENVVIYNLIKRHGKIRPYGGREIRFPVRTQRQEGTGWVPNNATALPTATVTGQIEPTFNVANFYGIGEITDMLIEDSVGDRMAYREGLDDIKDSLLTSFEQDIASSLWGDGTGAQAFLPAADNQTVITVDHPNWLREGKRVDLIDATDNQTKICDSRTITDVDHLIGSSVVTIDGAAAAGTAQGDYFVIEDSIGSGGEQYAPFGIQAAVNDANPVLGNYGGQDRTSVSKRWSSQVDDNSGTNRQLTERLILNNLGLARRRSNSRVGALRFIFPWDVASEYWEELVSDRQITVQGPEAMKLVGAFSGAADESGFEVGRFAGKIPMIADEMAPANIFWGLNFAPFRLYQTHDPELVSRDGNVLHRIETRPAYQFRYLFRYQLVVRDPHCQIRLEDIAHS